MRLWVWGFLLALAAGSAQADDADELRARGEDFARRGEYAQAIEQFTAADRIKPRAQHACMIGLAYLRRQLWPQSEIFLARCRLRATAADPLPEWLEDAEAQLATALAGANVTAVDIRVNPPSVAALVTVSAFPDIAFDPQVIHLPEGSHVVEISAPGFKTASQRVELVGRGERRIEVELERVAEPAVVLRRDPAKQRWSRPLVVGGSIGIAGGVVFHVLAVRTRGKLLDATTVPEYRDHEPAFDLQRAAAISLYGVGAIAAGIGVYLHLTNREVPVRVSAGPHAGGAFVTIGWEQ